MKDYCRLAFIGLLLASTAIGLAQPIIVAQPQDQTNFLGTTATFSITATGTLPLSYQWTFGAPPTNLDGATNNSLVITNVQTANQGPYQAVITNVQGAVTSLVATLYVTMPPTVQFTTSVFPVGESAGVIRLPVKRSGDTNLAVTVDYSTLDGTAVSGVKYTATSGHLVFAPGETNQTITVPILNEGFVEGLKTFRVTLSNPTAPGVLGVPSTATVSILDNDSGVQFQNATYSVSEDAGLVQIGLVRGDDGAAPVTVDLSTSDLSATNGLDYSGGTNSIVFAAQEHLKFVTIPILNNTLKQPNRSFRLTLANPVAASLGAQKTTTVTILDNDQGFQFGSANYVVSEDAGAARISVLRGTDATNSTVTVDYATADVTATNGINYLATNGTFSFGLGESVKTMRVAILNNGTRDPTRVFTLTLRNPGGGAALGVTTSARVSILDNDSGLGFERATYSTAWGQGTNFTVTVLRGNDYLLGPITVDYATANGSAIAGQDYQAVSGTLAFTSNETVKAINVPILQSRASAGGAKTFRVLLRNAQGAPVLGTLSTTVSIAGTYATVVPPFDTSLTITQDSDLNVLNWDGSGQLQRADQPSGPWQSLTNATNSCTVKSPVPTTFYRVARPRPVNLYVPTTYDGQKVLPLVILLHGYSETGPGQEAYMQFQPLAETRGFLYTFPDSTVDQWGNEFWNASDACCDFAGTGIDDAGYLRALVEEISREFKVDQKRIYLIGHSNGGFMAHRMACQAADLIAGIASLAGTASPDPGTCTPSQPVNILHIHGTADSTVPYWGGAVTTPNFPANLPQFLGAPQIIQRWSLLNNAGSPITDPAPSLDLTTDIAGLDTVVTRYPSSSPGGAVELWTINGGSHGPTLSAQFSSLIIDWLFAHPKP
jgi:polyhydroxybutyrate depolymerase